MNRNLIGNAPHQVPSNADLGEMAYQDSYWVRVGNITVDYNTTITGNTTVIGNLIVSSSTANVLLSGGANVVMTTGNVLMNGGNIEMSGGNLVMTTGNIRTSGNLTVGNIIVSSATGNVYLTSDPTNWQNATSGANLIMTGGNITMTTGNIQTGGNITTGGNLNVIGTGNVQVQSLIIAQGNIFCNTATLSSDPNTVTTRRYVDSLQIVFGV